MDTERAARSAVLAPGGYYLIKLGSGGAVGIALPAADATPAAATNMSATQGKLALVAGAAALADGCPAAGTVVDRIGWGTLTVPCFEGAAAAAEPANSTLSMQRKQVGCVDANDNLADFATAAVAPRNSASLTDVCRVTHNEGGDGFELDFCVNTTVGFTVATGIGITLVGEVFETSLTMGVPGASAGITAQVGYGPRDTNPEWQNGGWTFATAGFVGDVGPGGNNDQYSLTFAAPAAGAYSYAYRFSMDGGFNWTYCDLNGAGANPALVFETPSLALIQVTP